MVHIGPIDLPVPFFQAGLAGYSDAAMRMMARRHGAPYAITEAMLDTLLLSGGKALRHAAIPPGDHPIAGQIMGARPKDMGRAARILARLGYDAIDINLACPVRKIRKKFRGGHLLQTSDAAIAILREVRQAVDAAIPCTVKLRRAYDDGRDSAMAFHDILAATIDLGYAAATVHGRTVKQKYHGPAAWQSLRDLVRQYPNFPIFGSGDIWEAGDIFRMIRFTGVQAVSVARGCIGNPWIFAQAHAIMRGQAPKPPSIHQQRRVLLEHFALAVRYHGEKAASRQMRKFGIKFARHHPETCAVARAFIAVDSLHDWRQVLDRYYRDDISTRHQPGRATPAAMPS